MFARAIRNGCDVAEPDEAAGNRNGGCRDGGHILCLAQHPYGLFGTGQIGPPAGIVGVDGGERGVDLRCCHTERRQLQRVERDVDLARDSANARHLRHARLGLKRAGHGVVHEPR